jgi:exonuclease SbcD
MQDIVFYHCSDLHLGKTYVDSQEAEERYEDFFRVFSDIARQAVEEKIDALLIAGDLFHQAQVLPRTFARTVEVLESLKRAAIPVVAIEGNHDWIHRRENLSWIEALSAMGHVHLLRPERDADGGYRFPKWDEERQRGGRVEIRGVHFYGLGYIGAYAGSHVPRIVDAIKRTGTEENVLLFHVGIQQYCGTDIGNMTLEEALPLKEVCKYVALGHGHKPYLVTQEFPFAYNAGSPECVNFGEERYGQKGFHRIVWKSGQPPQVELIPTSPRPMINEVIPLAGCRNVSEAEEHVREHLEKVANNQNDSRRPVVRVKLTGYVEFRPVELSRQRIIKIVSDMLDPLHVEVENTLSFVTRSSTGLIERKQQSLAEVEREVVERLFAAQSAYQADAAMYAELAIRLKEKLLDRTADPSDLLEMIHRTLCTSKKSS